MSGAISWIGMSSHGIVDGGGLSVLTSLLLSSLSCIRIFCSITVGWRVAVAVGACTTDVGCRCGCGCVCGCSCSELEVDLDLVVLEGDEREGEAGVAAGT